MRLDRIALAGGLVLVGAAVATELAKPARERRWHGELVGVVPYDLRLPTITRARDRWWNPADERLSRASFALAAMIATTNICTSVSTRCTPSSVSKRVENIVWPVQAHQIRTNSVANRTSSPTE